MDKTSAILFDYAKAAGLLRKSFVQQRASELFQQNTLAELWSLLFKTPAPMMPEVLLAAEIEKQAFSNFINQYHFFIKQYSKPSFILEAQIKRYEVENLKEIFDALCSGEKDLPELLDLHGYSQLKTENWPNVAEITKQTNYQWVDHAPSLDEQQKMEFKLDLQLIKELWNAIQACSGNEKIGHEKLFLDEFVMKNIIWALRLSIFYNMDKSEVIKNLFYVGDAPSLSDPVAAPAIKVLDLDPSNYNDWENWKYKEYLNPYVSGENWKVSPSWIEKSSIIGREKRAFSIFHQYGMSDVALVAWFKIKSFELNCIRTAVEAIRLNVEPEEAMSIVGLSSSD
ncbi:MAG: V-type ATPase subunit [Treponema sp.]|nr:V-type ATPase subunit [Treponema sp.]